MTLRVINVRLNEVEIEQLRLLARVRSISMAALIRTRLRATPIELMSASDA